MCFSFNYNNQYNNGFTQWDARFVEEANWQTSHNWHQLQANLMVIMVIWKKILYACQAEDWIDKGPHTPEGSMGTSKIRWTVPL